MHQMLELYNHTDRGTDRRTGGSGRAVSAALRVAVGTVLLLSVLTGCCWSDALHSHSHSQLELNITLHCSLTRLGDSQWPNCTVQRVT